MNKIIEKLIYVQDFFEPLVEFCIKLMVFVVSVYWIDRLMVVQDLAITIVFNFVFVIYIIKISRELIKQKIKQLKVLGGKP